MTKTWCVGGRHYSDSINRIAFEKVNPKTKKNLLKLSKVVVVFVDGRNHKILLSK